MFFFFYRFLLLYIEMRTTITGNVCHKEVSDHLCWYCFSATIISAWGERGAMAHGHDGTIVQSPAFSPHKVLDTLGAGDTFCGATIFGLSRGKSLQDSIVLGCQIAGAKVGMDGFAGLDKVYKHIQHSSGES